MSEQAVKQRKVMSLIAAEPNSDRAAFRDRFLHQHAQRVLWHCPRIRRYVVDLGRRRRESRVPEQLHPPASETAATLLT